MCAVRDITPWDTPGTTNGAPACTAGCGLVCRYFPGLSGNLHVNVASSCPLSAQGGARLPQQPPCRPPVALLEMTRHRVGRAETGPKPRGGGRRRRPCVLRRRKEQRQHEKGKPGRSCTWAETAQLGGQTFWGAVKCGFGREGNSGFFFLPSAGSCQLAGGGSSPVAACPPSG